MITTSQDLQESLLQETILQENVLQEKQLAQRPWAQLADWLRMMHSVAKSETEMQIQESGIAFPAQQQAEAAAQPAKQRMRFVCNRHFVGLMIR